MKRKTLITSILVIVLCLALISGSTYSLFTSESSVNIAVTSGKVEVVATIDPDSLKVYSANSTMTTGTPVDKMDPTDTTGKLTGTFAGTYYYQGPLANGTFTNGGTAKLSNENTVLTIDKITPGDKVTVTVNVENKSNVKTKYRIRVNVLDGTTIKEAAESLKLFEGLVVKVGTDDAAERTATTLDGVIRVSNWYTLDEREANSTDNLADVPVEIFLPLDAGNEYQNLKTEIQITVEAVQSNASTALLDSINAILIGSTTKKNNTMYEAIQEVVANTQFTATDLYGFVWSVDDDLFYAETDVEESFEYKYFKAYTQAEYAALAKQTFSVYAYGTGWTTVDDIKVGFDAGETTGITSVTYNRSTATYGQEVVIRTNSFTTNIEINAPKDVIKHYDNAGTLNIIAAANASYHEYGKVAYAYISKGRMTIEEGSKVTNLHINSIKENNVTTNEFDSITISIAENANKPTFSRDDVEIAQNGTLVVAIQNGTEELTEETPLDYVWLTKQGVFEQIKVSESDTEITSNAQWADKLGSEKEKTQEAAFEIANNIGRNATTQKVEQVVTVGTTAYTVTLNEETRELVVENTTTSDFVTPEEKATVIDEAITKPSVVDNMDEIIEEAINADAVANGYVVRIDETYYNTFEAAYAEVKSGDTIHILQDCYASYHGPDSAYNFSGKNVNIYVEKDATLMCGDVTNGKFDIGWNNAVGTLTLEGPGKITFNSNSTWGLITQNGSGNNIKAVVKDVTIEASSAGGKIMSHDTGNLTVESGHYKNITFKAGQIKNGYTAKLNTATNYYDIVEKDPTEGMIFALITSTGTTYIDEAHVNSLTGFEDEVPAGATLKLLVDYTFSTNDSRIGALISFGNDSTLDLNGHTLTIDVPTNFMFASYIDKLTFKNGTIATSTPSTNKTLLYGFEGNAEDFVSSNVTYGAGILNPFN